jgi:UDP-N-acetylglucosamine:LPS N-acetylglucosamine transferase
MGRQKILYISGSIGLGHISKDLAIARELRSLDREVAITRIAAHPATVDLAEQGETLHPLCDSYASYSAFAESTSVDSKPNLVDYVFRSWNGWIRNVRLIQTAIKSGQFDHVIGNETYEIVIGLIFRLIRIEIPFVIIYDFLGLEAASSRIGKKLGRYILNFVWSLDRTFLKNNNRLAIFVGESEDIPDNRFGFLLPNRRTHALRYYHFVGYIVRFDPEDYRDRGRVRKELGYGEEPLVVCSIGGTSIGKSLLELCNQSYPLIKERVPALRMVLITGPRLAKESLAAHRDIEVLGFVPDLFKHYAACDLAVVQCGLSSTCELAALRRSFIFFPIEGHSEQEKVAATLGRYGAGVKRYLSGSTPKSLAELIVSNLGKEGSYQPIRSDGAEQAARLILQML